jgi:hypothetical protein
MTSILKVSEIQDVTNSNTALTIDSAGRVTASQRPAFFAHSPTSASSSSDTTLIFGTEVLDRTNNYNVSTGEFTCPVDGLYLFSWHCLHTSSGNYGITWLMQNGTAEAKAQTYSSAANGGSSTASVTLYCQANDVITIYNRGSSYSPVSTDNYAFFSGHFIG